MSKFKIGDIVRNPLVNDFEPFKNFIYLGLDGEFVKTLSTNGKVIEQNSLYKSIVFDPKYNFEVIGHSEAMDALIKELKKRA